MLQIEELDREGGIVRLACTLRHDEYMALYEEYLEVVADRQRVMYHQGAGKATEQLLRRLHGPQARNLVFQYSITEDLTDFFKSQGEVFYSNPVFDVTASSTLNADGSLPDGVDMRCEFVVAAQKIPQFTPDKPLSLIQLSDSDEEFDSVLDDIFNHRGAYVGKDSIPDLQGAFSCEPYFLFLFVPTFGDEFSDFSDSGLLDPDGDERSFWSRIGSPGAHFHVALSSFSERYRGVLSGLRVGESFEVESVSDLSPVDVGVDWLRLGYPLSGGQRVPVFLRGVYRFEKVERTLDTLRGLISKDILASMPTDELDDEARIISTIRRQRLDYHNAVAELYLGMRRLCEEFFAWCEEPSGPNFRYVREGLISEYKFLAGFRGVDLLRLSAEMSEEQMYRTQLRYRQFRAFYSVMSNAAGDKGAIRELIFGRYSFHCAVVSSALLKYKYGYHVGSRFELPMEVSETMHTEGIFTVYSELLATAVMTVSLLQWVQRTVGVEAREQIPISEFYARYPRAQRTLYLLEEILDDVERSLSEEA